MSFTESVGLEIASAMLLALTAETIPADTNIARNYEQKRYLMRYADSLSIEDRKCIGNILIMNGKADKLQWCAEGTVIHLDNLPHHIVEQMYNLMTYKINLKTQQ